MAMETTSSGGFVPSMKAGSVPTMKPGEDPVAFQARLTNYSMTTNAMMAVYSNLMGLAGKISGR